MFVHRLLCTERTKLSDAVSQLKTCSMFLNGLPWLPSKATLPLPKTYLGYQENLYEHAMTILRFQNPGVGMQRFSNDYFPSNILSQSHRETMDRTFKDSIEPAVPVRGYSRTIINVAHNRQGDILVHYAASCGFQQTLSTLVVGDPDCINSKNVNGETPLLQACRSGHCDIVLFLLEHGADPKIASDDGCTPLHWLHSFETEKIKLIGRTLFAHGGNPNAFAFSRSYTECAENTWLEGTPLVWAVLRNCLHAVKVLLDLGADVSPAIRIAALLHYPEILNLLFSKSPTASRNIDQHGYSLLGIAISGGSIHMPNGSLLGRIRRHGVLWCDRAQQTMQLILEQDSAIDLGNIPPYKGLTALVLGVQMAEVDIVAFLLQNGCDKHLNTPSPAPSDPEKYITPLEVALYTRKFEIFRLLLNYKVDVTSLPSNHPNLLYACAALNIDDRRYAQALLDAGLSVDDAPSGHETALGCAVRSRSFELAGFLLERGADINNKYCEGLYFTEIIPHTVLGYLILENSTNSIICIDFLFNHHRSQPSFVVSGTNFTALHVAAGIPQERQDQQATEIILRRLMEYFKPTQAQLDMVWSEKEYTALHIACKNDNLEAVRILLGARANATLKDADGYTPLDLARFRMLAFPKFFTFRDETKNKEHQLVEAKARLEDIVSLLERWLGM
ncbi:ankyrin repeat-containing domain protein [Trichophaea hybrida]|nr:ankyrin repeat-containing domain protein [Trichophaea hybrida]